MKIRNDYGFTLLELVITLAIISVISAIAVPNFINSLDKSRLRSDINSARVIQSVIELYDMEQADQLNKSDFENVMANLIDKDYLSAKNVKIQTNKAKWLYYDNKQQVVVDISLSSDNIKEIADGLNDNEKEWLIR